MFTLTNIENQITVSCNVIDYEFPDDRTDNWCVVKTEVKQGERSFKVTRALFETEELVNIFNWFDALSRGRLPAVAMLTFIEPYIRFQFLSYRDGVVQIGIWLEEQLKPDFKIKQFKMKKREWCIICDLDQEIFGELLKTIGDSVEHFPVRWR